MKKKDLDYLIKCYPKSKIWKLASYKNKNLDSVIVTIYIDYIMTEFDSNRDLKKIVLDQNKKNPKYLVTEKIK